MECAFDYDRVMEEKRSDRETPELPTLSGTYALVLAADNEREVQIGKLGVLHMLPGIYVYVGSALGPGGLASSVGRHARCEKKLRWHIDYLRAAAEIEEVWYATGNSHRECRWARVLGTLPGASVPLPRFGASDCDCSSHLCFFNLPPSLADFRKKLGNYKIERLVLPRRCP
jgi:Uri superfamily endonuclease